MKKFILAICILLPINALAANWELVAEDYFGDKYYFDKKSLNSDKNNPDIRVAWMLIDYAKAASLEGDETYHSGVYKEKINCSTITISTIEGYAYSENMKNGNIIDSYTSQEDNWKSHLPGSTGDAFIKAVCKHPS